MSEHLIIGNIKLDAEMTDKDIIRFINDWMRDDPGCLEFHLRRNKRGNMSIDAIYRLPGKDDFQAEFYKIVALIKALLAKRLKSHLISTDFFLPSLIIGRQPNAVPAA